MCYKVDYFGGPATHETAPRAQPGTAQTTAIHQHDSPFPVGLAKTAQIPSTPNGPVIQNMCPYQKTINTTKASDICESTWRKFIRLSTFSSYFQAFSLKKLANWLSVVTT